MNFNWRTLFAERRVNPFPYQTGEGRRAGYLYLLTLLSLILTKATWGDSQSFPCLTWHWQWKGKLEERGETVGVGVLNLY